MGTSSPRRACQLRALRPDLELLDIRGNVDTRLRKLREGQYDAIVLAAAGLERLGELDKVTAYFDIDVMIPAVGQGALAVEVRSSDKAIIEVARQLNDPPPGLRSRRNGLSWRGWGAAAPCPWGHMQRL